MKEEQKRKLQLQLKSITKSGKDPVTLEDEYVKEINDKKEKLEAYRKLMKEEEEKLKKMKLERDKFVKTKELLHTLKTGLAEKSENIDNIKTIREFEKFQQEIQKEVDALQVVSQTIKNYKDGKKKIKDLLTLISSSAEVYAPRREGSALYFGRLQTNGKKVKVHGLQRELPPPSAFCLAQSYEECLHILTGGKELPRKVFMQFSSNGKVLGEVIFRVGGTIASTKSFLLLSLGSSGTSFRGQEISSFLSDYNQWIYSQGVPLPFDVDISQDIVKEKIWRQGEVGTQFCERNGRIELMFLVCVEDGYDELSYIPFGEIDSGLSVCKEAHQRMENRERILITQCGFLTDIEEALFT